ncbi:ROK family protein [Enterococcus massiliensis]|uniref:ROK family protein n=1 Tax=Enterococcus massiliensis TaxID=1640685 RepID=UPI00065DC882|nr:ROK family protein [Enterococcus massiliensis]
MNTNKNMIRDRNLQVLKNFLFIQGTALKAEMARETGISVVTINSLVKQLVDEKVFIDDGLKQLPLGRPATAYRFNYDQNHFLLLSIQEKKVSNHRKLIIIGKIVNLSGEIKHENTIDFSEINLDFLISFITSFLDLSYMIDKIGLSLPGKVYNGVVLSSWGNLFNQWNIEQALATRTSIPLIIQNDAHLLTIGYTISQKLNKSKTIVGIFYPENSMPGITIYSNGVILEGKNHLAGEAKYLPHLIDSFGPSNEMELITNLIEILAIYNTVIAPNSFIISAESIDRNVLFKEIEQSSILPKQVNQPDILFVENFQDSLMVGLRWLVTQDSPYHL